MITYNADIDRRIVTRVEREFPDVQSAIVLNDNTSSYRYNPMEVQFDSNSTDLLFVGNDGRYHHQTLALVQFLSEFYPIFAYLHIDRHTDLAHRCNCGNFVSEIFDSGIPVYILADPIRGNEWPKIWVGEENAPNPPSEEFAEIYPKGFKWILPQHRISLIKLLPFSTDTADWDFMIGNHFAKYVDNIEEEFVYASTDLDAFPSEEFHTYSDPTLRVPNHIDGRRISRFKKEAMLRDSKFSLSIPEFLEDRRIHGLDHNIFDITTYKEFLAEILQGHILIGTDLTGLCLNGSEDPLSISENDRSLDNLIDLIRFWQQIYAMNIN